MEKNFPTFTRKKGKKNSPSKPRQTKDQNTVKQPNTAGYERKDYKPTTPKLPAVNLLPPALLVQVQRRRLRFVFVLAAFVIIAVSGMYNVYQRTATEIEQKQVEATEYATSQQQQKVAEFGATGEYVNAIEARKALASTIAATPINYPQTYATLAAALPPGSSYASIVLTANESKPGDTAANKTFIDTCGQTTDPFNPAAAPVAACIKVTGQTTTVGGVEQLSRALRANPQFQNVFITQSTGTTNGTFGFQGSMNIRKG